MNNYSAINVLAASPLLDVYIYIIYTASANHVGPMIFHLGPSLFPVYMQNQTETSRFEGSPQRKTHAFAKGMHDAWLLHCFGAQMLSPTGRASFPQTDRIFQNKGFCYEQLLYDKCPSCYRCFYVRLSANHVAVGPMIFYLDQTETNRFEGFP